MNQAELNSTILLVFWVLFYIVSYGFKLVGWGLLIYFAWQGTHWGYALILFCLFAGDVSKDLAEYIATKAK